MCAYFQPAPQRCLQFFCRNCPQFHFSCATSYTTCENVQGRLCVTLRASVAFVLVLLASVSDLLPSGFYTLRAFYALILCPDFSSFRFSTKQSDCSLLLGSTAFLTNLADFSQLLAFLLAFRVLFPKFTFLSQPSISPCFLRLFELFQYQLLNSLIF